jgi:hypothetical protein
MLEIIKSLSATSKRTEKMAILESLQGDVERLFKKISKAAYDPEINYFIKKYDRPTSFNSSISLDFAINSLSSLTSRKVTGNAAIEFIQNLESSLSEDDAEVFNLIISRDLKCGVSTSTINKVWSDLIYDPPYMRCSSFNKKNLARIKFPAYSQTKEDGLYVDIIVRKTGEVEYRTRTGSLLALGDEVKNRDLATQAGHVLMGEALVVDDEGNYLDRKTGNGYLNSDDIDTSKVRFVIWDIVPVHLYELRKCAIEYRARFHQVKRFIDEGESGHFKLVDTRVVNSVQEVIDHFKENLERGKEGTVIKNQTGIWSDYDSPDQVKCKIEFVCDLKIIKVKEGTGKNVGKLGAFDCESEDGLIKVSVGGGFTDKHRVDYFDENMVDKIISVKSNDIINNRTEEGTWSLFLPRHTEIRHDKKTADTYEKVLEQRDSFIELLSVIQ